MGIDLCYGIPPVEAAQRALEAAGRRRKLALKISGGGDGADKRDRPTPPSTKVTPEKKKQCEAFEGAMEPKKLSFSDADSTGDMVWNPTVMQKQNLIPGFNMLTTSHYSAYLKSLGTEGVKCLGPRSKMAKT